MMKIKILTLILVFFSPIVILAQIDMSADNASIFDPSNHSADVFLSSNSQLEFNSFSIDLCKHILDGGELTKEDKDLFCSKLMSENKFVLDHELYAGALWNIANQKAGKLGFRVKARLYAGLALSDECCQLAVNGNRQFEDEIINVGDNYLAAQLYSDFAVHYQTPKIQLNEKGATFWGDISAGLRLGHFDFSMNTSNMKIQSIGLYEEISIFGMYDVKLSFDNNNINGYGAALDLALHFENIVPDHYSWGVHIYTNNLGFIKWNKNSRQWNDELAMTFGGIDFDDYDATSDNIDDQIDSLITAFTENYSRLGYTGMTPASLNLKANFLFRQVPHLIVGLEVDASYAFCGAQRLLASLAPSIGSEWTRKDKKRAILVQIPVTYSTFSGVGVSGKLIFTGYRESGRGYSLILSAGSLGQRALHTYGSLGLRFLVP
ncbi:MAG: DUF5723 family protein [Bacteroidales bacterium]|nr:DUF5723 family protein [Bacteroidales bacterium]